MKTDQIRTLCLIPESNAEYKHWESLLEPYCWAQGEFGIILTEAAVREIINESVNDTELSQVVRKLMLTVAEILEVGDYADVCLRHAATLVGDATLRGEP